jgi:hypothetical protein
VHDHINWTFIWLVIIQLGMNLKVVNWIMGSLNNTSFTVLMNDDPSRFFRASIGLHQGCPLSPFLFLIIVETLRKMLKEVGNEGRLRGLKVMEIETIFHLLFVDDIWVSIYGSLRDVSSLTKILYLFYKETGMKINLENSCLLTSVYSGAEVISFLRLFHVQYEPLEGGFKYLGFHVNPEKYKKSYWA